MHMYPGKNGKIDNEWNDQKCPNYKHEVDDLNTWCLPLTSTHFLGRVLSAHCLSLMSTAVLKVLEKT